jgi:hypothetical protein
MRRLLLAVALVACSATVRAEFLDGNQLLERMNGSNMDRMLALGYVMAASDAVRGSKLCDVPPTVTAGQTHDMVKAYLERFPQVRHFTADVLVSRALEIMWPCSKAPASSGSRSL